MFTGIINSLGIIASAQQSGDLRIAIACDFAGELAVGESVAVNGACLTVVKRGAWNVERESTSHVSRPTHHDFFSADLSAETLARTAPRWSKGQRVHLERALKMGDRLDGHLVTGHIDGMAVLKNILPSGESYVLELEAPPALSRFIAEKGSVTLDGVSLTVNKVEDHRFWVNIIPHTWQVTTFSERAPGDALNLEIDIIARYAARLLQKA